jgi:para-aminobenzoate synthetase/4-amino-4-deoxychorismate lyase
MTQPPKRDLEEIMEFDPEEGVANLEHHLDRLKSEAGEAGFSFDRHAARNELQAATFGKRRPGTARLLLSPSGAIAIEFRSS